MRYYLMCHVFKTNMADEVISQTSPTRQVPPGHLILEMSPHGAQKCSLCVCVGGMPRGRCPRGTCLGEIPRGERGLSGDGSLGGGRNILEPSNHGVNQPSSS